MNEELTEQQEWERIWQICLEHEKVIKSIPKNDSRDKGIDWDTQKYLWDKWNPRNLK
jgi:hypothetical protein